MTDDQLTDHYLAAIQRELVAMAREARQTRKLARAMRYGDVPRMTPIK